MSDRIACVGGNTLGIDHFGNNPGTVNFLPYAPSNAHPNFFFPAESLTNMMMWFWGVKKWHFIIDVGYTIGEADGMGGVTQVPHSAHIELDLSPVYSTDEGVSIFVLPTGEKDLMRPMYGSEFGGSIIDGVFSSDELGTASVSNFSCTAHFTADDFQGGLVYFLPYYYADDQWSCEWGFALIVLDSSLATSPGLDQTREFTDAITITDVNGTRNTGLSVWTEDYAPSGASNITSYSATMTATEYWPHKNKAGQPVYDTSTGVQINSLP